MFKREKKEEQYYVDIRLRTKRPKLWDGECVGYVNILEEVNIGHRPTDDERKDIMKQLDSPGEVFVDIYGFIVRNTDVISVHFYRRICRII